MRFMRTGQNGKRPPAKGRRLTRWSLAGVLCLLPPVALARGTPSHDLLDMSMEELMQVKVTSSTLSDENLKTVPSSMTVFTRADIRRLGLKHLRDLINLVPGFQGSRADDSVLSYSVSSRGRRVGSSGREVLVLVDGQRLNNDWTGGAGQHTNLISIENAERVELIRGPGSALYGSNAMLGVINIITRSERELVLETGTDDRRHASAQWRAEGEHGRIDVYARDTRSGGEDLVLFEPFTNPATPVQVNSSDPFRANDLYVRGEAGDFFLSGMASTRDAQHFYVAGYVDDLSNSYDTRTDNLALGWRHAFTDALKLEGRVFQSHRQLSVISAVSLVPYFLLQGSTDEREQGTQWTLQGRVGEARWLAGWEWRNPEMTDTFYIFGPPQNPTQVQAYQAPEDGRYIRGWFGQYQQKLADSLELIAGLRQDNYSDFGDHLSPRLGLVQQAGNNDTFKLLYSEAFRAPSRIETSVISPEFESSPNLKPETAKTTELIWLHFVDSGYVATTLFESRIDDAILETVTPLLRRTWVNSQQSVSGLELEWQYHWSEHWQSRMALTRLFSLDTATSAESDNLLGGSVSYENGGWTLSLLANYQGPKLDANEQNIPANITSTEYTRFGGRTLYGVHVAYQLTPALNLYLHGDNLFDKQYYSPANRGPNFVGAPGTGQLILAGLRWEVD